MDQAEESFQPVDHFSPAALVYRMQRV